MDVYYGTGQLIQHDCFIIIFFGSCLLEYTFEVVVKVIKINM